jgi:HSP20 family protein
MLVKEVADNHRISPFFPLLDESASGYLPPLDVHESDERYELRLDVPGVAKSALKLHFEQDALTIRGERDGSSETARRSERWSGQFERTLSIPESIDADKIEATLRDGVLTVVLPKAEKAKPRQIAVE